MKKWYIWVCSPLPEYTIGIYVMSKWESSLLPKIQEKEMLCNFAFQAVLIGQSTWEHYRII